MLATFANRLDRVQVWRRDHAESRWLSEITHPLYARSGNQRFVSTLKGAFAEPQYYDARDSEMKAEWS